MGATDKLLINFSKQSRKQNPSARPGQLAMIRGADPGQTDDHFHARRCIAKNDNLVLGYRQGQEAGRMDSEQKVQNGRGASCVGDCCGSGHSLMSLVPFVVLAIMLILPQCAALDPCTDRITIDESWRDVSITAVTETNHCDRNTFVENQWYSFRINDKPATIPTTCIKRNMCGAKIAMRVDLNGQSLPKTKGENITASLCGSYDVLGKYDCCVLRSEVNIMRCDDDNFVYNFPKAFDRCPVAVCALGEKEEVPPKAIARMGEDVDSADVTTVKVTTLKDFESTHLEVNTTPVTRSGTTSELHETSDADIRHLEVNTTPVTRSGTTSELHETSDADIRHLEVNTTPVTRSGTTSDLHKTSDADIRHLEVNTTPVTRSGTTSELHETTDADLPPQPLMQKTTVLGTTVSDSTTDGTTVTEFVAGSTRSKVSETTSEIANDKQGGGKTTDKSTETESVSQQDSETSELTTVTYTSRGATKDTSQLILSSQRTQTSTETDNNSLFTTTQETSSENTDEASSTVDPIIAKDKTSSDLTSETNKISNDASSTTSKHSSEITPTTNELSSEAISTTENDFTDKQPTNQEPSEDLEKVTADVAKETTSDTNLFQNLSETAPTSSSSSIKTVESKTTSVIDTTISTASTSGVAKTTTSYIASTLTDKVETRSGVSEKESVIHDPNGDIKIIETIRLVFKGNHTSLNPATSVLVLLDRFLMKVSEEIKAKDDSAWTYKITSVSEAIGFENRKTYMDFDIEHTDIQGILTIFDRFHLKKFISENSNLTLLAECRSKKNCQHDSVFIVPQASVFEQNAPAFITVIVMCSVCVLILVLALMYYHLTKRGSWKASPEYDASPENRHYISGNQSPFTDDQIMKDEMIDNASFNGSAKDGDTNLSSTWVIPLDQDPSSPKTVVSVSTEDTQL